jgi:glycine/D-amino acid oxidase-like deaminating enzyme
LIAVIGGGVIGLSVAYYLSQGGAEVVLYERGMLGRGCTWGGAGWISPSESAPVVGPQAIRQAVYSLGRPAAPLYLRPALDPGVYRWLLQAIRYCNSAAAARGLRAVAELSRPTFELYDELKRAGLDGGMTSHGLLHVFRRPRPAARSLASAAVMRHYGYTVPDDLLTGTELRELEPTLSRRAETGYYIGTSSRLSYALGRNGYFPPAISRISKRGVPFTSIIISFVAGMLFFLPFPSWSGLVELATSALVFMYALAPLALGGLRREDPGRHRPYRLPAAGVLSPLAFIFANLLVYFAGFSTVLWLEVLIVLGFIAFAIYQARLPAARRTVIDPRAALWVPPWLIGLLLLSWLGRYNGSPPTVFGVTLLATNHLPNWWDLAAIAAFSLVIYYWAVHSTLPHQRVSAAVEQVETEASVELDKSLV